LTTVGTAGRQLVTDLAGFGRVLRGVGIEVGPGRVQDALLALTAVDLSSRDQVYWALRCTLLSRHGDIEAFDHAFARFFGERWCDPPETHGTPPPHPGEADAPREDSPSRSSVETAPAGENQFEEPEEAEAGMCWSAVERLRDLDFARYGADELRQAARLVDRIAAAAPLRRSRRLRASGDRGVFDKRRTLRHAMRTDGYPVVCRWREPRLVPRKLVFVVDVSGSMTPYARAMMMFLQAAVRAGRRVEAFTFGTRLTRLTRELEARDPDRGLVAATRAVRDWAGGTRIGANLKTLNDGSGRLGTTRGAVVVIVSDGWERGDIDLLGREMARLHRMAHTTVWVNPLAGERGYEPLAQGMAAALPHVDYFLPGHNLRSLEALAKVLEMLPVTQRQELTRRA
jgi:uncharacterized protein